MLRVLTIFLNNIINRSLNLFIGAVSRTYLTNFLKDNFNVIPFANNSDVVACFINRNENKFVMKLLEIFDNSWSFENWINFLIFEFTAK